MIKLADFLQMEHLIKSVSLMITETLGMTNISVISNLVQMKQFIKENMFEMCKKGLLDLLKLHLEDLEDKNPGDEDKYTLLHCAAEHGHLNIVEYVVPLLNDINPRTAVNLHSKGADQETPLHLAAKRGHLHIVEFLEHLNHDINPANGYGWTVLHEAALYGHLNVVAFYTAKLDNPNPGQI